MEVKWETKLTTVFCFKTVEIVANNNDCYEQTKPQVTENGKGPQTITWFQKISKYCKNVISHTFKASTVTLKHVLHRGLAI